MKKTRKLLFPLLFSIILVATAALHLASALSQGFADKINASVSAAVRTFMSFLTGWFRFSLAEILLLSSPLLLFLLIFFGIRAIKSAAAFRRYVAATLSGLLAFYLLFVLTLGVGYRTTPLRERMALPDTAVTGERLYAVSLWALNEADRLCVGMKADKDTGSRMPLSWEEMTEELNTAYARLSEAYPFIDRQSTALKPVMLSEPMTYTGIVGVYSFFTGESNINTTYPDYCTVFTAAHEMAHQRGIAREDEANFIAFLACISADSEYIRYAGYLNLTDYTASALSQTDKPLYKDLVTHYSERTLAEKRAAALCYEAHRNDTVREVTESVNNSYLQSQGTQGTVSYSLVVELAVDYYAACVSDK